MENVLGDLAKLWSFDHGRCDAILLQRGIEIANAFNPRKSPMETFNIGLPFLVLWGAVVWAAYRNTRDPRSRPLFAVFAVFGLVCLGVQLWAIADYSRTCIGLLQGSR